MSGSQHNPNGRQAQLGSGWSPLQLQMANLLARAPQAHMASERGVTWHTPTPPPHLYHVPAPSPPDPLQAMKGASNSVFRHTATPPELYRHTPTPPDKHLLRHTPSPGDVKVGPALPPADLYAHMGPSRDKLVRPEDLLTYARGVDLSLSSRSANGAAAGPALSVRDAPTINSLIARAQPRGPHARLDSLLERLAPAPAHSVIVHPRAAREPRDREPGEPEPPAPPALDEDDSCGAVPGSKRKRKPERTVRVSAPSPVPDPAPRIALPGEPLENGDAHRNGPDVPRGRSPTPEPKPHVRRKTRSGSAETIDDIAAMIASTDRKEEEPQKEERATEPPVTIDKLKSVLASPEATDERIEDVSKSPPQVEESPTAPVAAAAAAPASPSEARPAEPHAARSAEPYAEPHAARTTEPAHASFVEVENQLEKMFAGIEEEPQHQEGGDQQVEKEKPQTTKARKRRKSAPTKGERKAARRAGRATTVDGKKARKPPGRSRKEPRDAYDSGSNASSSRSRGPYIQIRGARDSPRSVAVVNAGAEDEEAGAARGAARGGARPFRGARGLHCSTLGRRYDATTADTTWQCAFCERGPHAAGLGDLFGPYPLDTDCDEYRALDEAGRRRHEAGAAWLHEPCAVWAPGLLAAGARLWGLAEAVWAARGARCAGCGRGGAGMACAARGCGARAHVPCAARWQLAHATCRALCPRHAPPAS